jgi:hypothetical protein
MPLRQAKALPVLRRSRHALQGKPRRRGEGTELPREALEERCAGTASRVRRGVAVVHGQVEEHRTVRVGRVNEVAHDEHAVVLEGLGLHRERGERGAPLVTAEGGDVVEHRGVEDRAHRPGREDARRHIPLDER